MPRHSILRHCDLDVPVPCGVLPAQQKVSILQRGQLHFLQLRGVRRVQDQVLRRGGGVQTLHGKLQKLHFVLELPRVRDWLHGPKRQLRGGHDGGVHCGRQHHNRRFVSPGLLQVLLLRWSHLVHQGQGRLRHRLKWRIGPLRRQLRHVR